MSRLSVLLLLVAVVAVTADLRPGVMDHIASYFYSPSPEKCGTKTCDPEGIFHFYDCLETVADLCFFRLQGWVVFLIVSLLVSILFSCIGGIISCLCCCGRK
ncbi:hypothetical protein PRIPAC_87057 [Pristionchus pacificus]|uniref:Uncharacterized protein n=1 Tax=Pristionchus pacificus TaxID=54126 RepID=A0A2A6CC78_PRIPA|nr:hypothetical protein PRIPAC_87057 [Pristionchus pacificus]|eukprot:PDM75726.1 hypothetical protein PRIPAC_40105 [Pristionchus pacificus]